MKKKGIFLTIFIILLTVMSLMITSLFNDGKLGVISFQEEISDGLNNEVSYFIVYLSRLGNDDYEVLSFENTSLSQIDRDMILNDIEEMLTSEYLYLYNSDYVTYKVENKAIDRVFESREQCEEDKCLFYGQISFDSDGKIETSKDYPYAADIYSSFTNYVYECMQSYGLEYEFSNVTIHLPKNVSITVGLSEECMNDFRFFDDYNDIAGEFTVICLIVGTVILGLLLLFYSIDIVKEVEPFAFVRKLKLELNLIILGTLTALLILWILFLSMITINGGLSVQLSQYSKDLTEIMILGIYFISWFVVFLVISLDIFDIKYILLNGKEYFIHNSIISSVYHFIKAKISMLLDIDLSDSIDKKLVKLALIHMVIMIALCSMFAFGAVLSIIYTVIVFFFLRKHLNKVREDYYQLLNMTHSMSEGQLNTDIQTNLGVFNSYKEELQLVRTGFKKAVDEEVKSTRMKTELITNVSHDLKTPLTGLRNYIELLQDKSIDNDHQKEYIQKLEHYVLKLSTLIEDLFEISKVNSGNIQLKRMNIDVIELLYQTQSELEEQLSAKSLDIIVNNQKENYILCLDNQKTYRIFENLFINISKYALAHTRVYIDIYDDENSIYIVFKNISEDSLNFNTDEIVERFTRGDKSRNSEGSGLGLAIVKSFVEVQGGTFHIETDGDLFKAIISFEKEVSHKD